MRLVERLRCAHFRARPNRRLRCDRGTNLSSGEWQTIALAHTYLSHAQRLCFDAPAAALPARSDHEVYRRVSEHSDDHRRATSCIPHRYSAVRMVDHIAVLHDGIIVGEVQHGHLIAMGGRYAELVALQAAGHR